MPETKEQFLERIEKYESKHVSERTEFSDLPAWVKSALAMHELIGVPLDECASRASRAASSLYNYSKSPAAKAWKKELQEVMNNPREVAALLLRSNVHSVTMDYYAVYEKAMQANDYTTAAKIIQDLLDRSGLTKQKEQREDKIEVILKIGNGDGANLLNPPTVEISYEEVEASSDYEILESNE